MQYRLVNWTQLKEKALAGDERAVAQLIDTLEEIGEGGNVIDLENAEWEL